MFIVDVEIVGYGLGVGLGDVLVVYPENNPEHVRELMRFFGVI